MVGKSWLILLVSTVIGILLIIGGIYYFMFMEKSDSPPVEGIGVSIVPIAGWEPIEITLGEKILSSDDGLALVTVSKSKDFEGQGVGSAKEYGDAFIDSIRDVKGFELIDTSVISVSGVDAEVRIFSFDDGEFVKTKFVVTEKYNGGFYLFSFMSTEDTFDERETEFDEMLTTVELK